MGGFVGPVALALLVVLGPGAALLLALGVRRPVVFLALAAPCSAAVASWVGNATALVGLRYSWIALAVTTGLLIAGSAVVEVRRRPIRQVRRTIGTSSCRRTALVLVAAAAVSALAVIRAARSWWTGLNGALDTVGQEHDMVMHTVLTAFIARSGEGAVWQLAPVDLLSGGPAGYYPSGFHVQAAIVAQLLGLDVVAAVNATTVVSVCVVASLGTAALAVVAARRCGLGRPAAITAAAFAVVIATSLYRPAYQLIHDGGVIANVAAFSLLPGVLAGVLALRRPSTTGLLAAGIAAGGLVTVHPSAMVSLAITILAWWLGELLVRRERAGLQSRVLATVGVAGVAVVVALPTLLSAAAAGGRTQGFPIDTPLITGTRALGLVFGFPYSGFIDPTESLWQVAPTALLVAAVVVLLVARRGGGPLVAFAVWSLLSLGQLAAPTVPGLSTIAGFYYNAWVRITSHLSVLAPVVIALGLTVAASSIAAVVRRRVGFPPHLLSGALVLLVALVYLAVPGRDYAARNTEAVATRYGTPDFSRVDGDDARAINFLAGVVRPGQRVMNSANDGSTYLYVERGVPVVEIGTLGIDEQPYTYDLLAGFNQLGRNPAIDALVRTLNIRWVYVDARAPQIGSLYSPGGWAPTSGYTTAPGLADLDRVPDLRKVFSSGSVSVYSVAVPAG